MLPAIQSRLLQGAPGIYCRRALLHQSDEDPDDISRGTMILLLDLCYRPGSLSHPEFVSPIRRIVENKGNYTRVVHYSELVSLPPGVSGVILCGTALKDNGYLDHMDLFHWLEDSHVPVLGICAGMQVLASLLGGEVIPAQEIGMTDVNVITRDEITGEERTFPAYELHNFGVTLPPGCTGVARSGCCLQAFRYDRTRWRGVMFHPEVRNEWVVERFVNLTEGGSK
jgi:GMP synthase-like glutamine amidotransferase